MDATCTRIVNSLEMLETGINTSVLKELCEQLCDSIAHFRFVKKDGTERWAWGTRNLEIIERHLGLSDSDEQRRKAPPSGVLTYFDMEKGAWRSFCLDGLKEVEQVFI